MSASKKGAGEPNCAVRYRTISVDLRGVWTGAGASAYSGNEEARQVTVTVELT